MASTLPLALAPAFAFDIDGVVRSLTQPFGVVEGIPLEAREITFHEERYPQIYHGVPPFTAGTYTDTLLFNMLAIEWMKSLIARGYEVVLATTWQHHANEYFLSAFGIPELAPAVVTLTPYESNREHCSHGWKAKQLAQAFPGRPLLWVDDSVPHFPEESLPILRPEADAHLSSHLLIEGLFGISPEDVAEGEAWLAHATTAEGHEVLRARHSQFLDTLRRYFNFPSQAEQA